MNTLGFKNLVSYICSEILISQQHSLQAIPAKNNSVGATENQIKVANKFSVPSFLRQMLSSPLIMQSGSRNGDHKNAGGTTNDQTGLQIFLQIRPAYFWLK